MTSFLTGVVAGRAIAMPPGAVTALIVGLGLRRGFRTALAAGSGTATVDGAYCVAAVLAGTAIVPLLGAVTGPLRVATGLVLVALGVAQLLRPRRDAPAGTAPDGRDLAATYVRFVGITLVNPATLAYFVAIAFGSQGTLLADPWLFVAGVFGASLSWHVVLATLSGALHGRLGPRARFGLTAIASVVVIGLGIRILTQA